jgi:hypothetical protein
MNSKFLSFFILNKNYNFIATRIFADRALGFKSTSSFEGHKADLVII